MAIGDAIDTISITRGSNELSLDEWWVMTGNSFLMARILINFQELEVKKHLVQIRNVLERNKELKN